MNAVIDELAPAEATDMDEENALVTGLRRDESAAHEAFVWRYGQRLLATARRFLPCDQDCYDAVQETFLAAFQGIDRFAGNSRLGTWLHRILVNVCLMKLRSRARWREILMDDLCSAGNRHGQTPAWKARECSTVTDDLWEDEIRILVRSSIDLLPDDFRSVLLLRDMEELDTATTAETLDISPGVVKTRLHRAR